MVEGFQVFAKEARNKKLFQMEDFFQENREQYIERFRVNFRAVCETIVNLQKNGKLPAISYLEYTMLHTNFYCQNYTAEICVYGKDWYMDRFQSAVGTFDVSHLFGKFTELWDELLTERKRYVGKVRSMEVGRFMIPIIKDFFAYAVLSGRFGILECLEDKNYQAIQKTDEFDINMGEYMGYTETIHRENRGKDREAILGWFRQHQQFDYVFGDFTGLDFSEEDFSEMDFRYSDLRNTILKGTDLREAVLFGTRFCHADMEHADLRYCLLYEADFTGANLRNAQLTLAKANAGIHNTEWIIAGYMGVSFREADLRNADFTKSSFLGADFTGARMDGTIFSREHAERLKLSEEQRSAIVIK